MANSAITGFGGGRVVQVVNTTKGTVVSLTGNIPYDNTAKPLITEGTEVMSLAITPTSVSNKLKVDVVCFLSGTATNAVTAMLVNPDIDGTSAIACGNTEITANGQGCCVFTYYVTAPQITETTFSVRAGGTSGTHYLNAISDGNPVYAGIEASSITITEIGPGTGTIASDGSSQQYAVKAWASISYSGGVPTLDDSYNVSGIVDDGVGLITVNWDTDFGSVNYAVVATLDGGGVERMIATIHTKAVGSTKFFLTNHAGTLQDPTSISVIAIGD